MKKLNKRQIASFCCQLKMLLAAGLPFLEALKVFQNISRQKGYEDIISKISHGHTIAQSMQELFPPIFISSIAGAQKAGNLEEVLGRLSKYYEDRAELEEKIRSALIYPVFVVVLCFCCLSLVCLFVLPGFKDLFKDLGTDLPLFTQIIVNAGDGLKKVWFIPPIIGVALGIAVARYRRTEKGALVLDELFLKIKYFRREQIIHSFRTLGSLLAGGDPILGALRITAETNNNQAFRKILFEIRQAIEIGEQLSHILSCYKLFPKEVIQMVSVGENTGKLAEMLFSICSFYERQRELHIKRFTAMLEPALTLFIGIVVGIVALAVFLPMVNMISRLQ
ncbi:MAG: type II secretion system F family protein [Candidatus Saganbacteria bacterium]|nr:type II secretion system F family protein [Candidatus Saganbacteria bacterium]